MKLKSIIALGLIGVLGIGSVKISAKTLQNTIPKNTLITEKSTAQSVKSEANEIRLKEIAKNAFEKYFNKKLDVDNLKESMDFVKADVEWNPYEKDYYEIVFGNGDMTSGKDYYANVEPNGKIIDMGIISKERIKPNEVTLIPLEEAKKIAAHFIKENKLASERKEAKFLGEATIGPEICGVVYEVGENTGVIISVDSKTKEVTAFSYHTLSDSKRAVEINDFRSTGILG